MTSKKDKNIIERTNAIFLPDEKKPVESTAVSTPIEQALNEPRFINTLQGKPFHVLFSITQQNIQIDDTTHVGKIEKDDVIIIFEQDAIKNMTPQTAQVLLIILSIATIQLPHRDAINADTINKGRKIKLTLAKYMEIRKIKDVKEARNQLNKAINALYGISFDWTETKYETPKGKSRRVKIDKPYRTRLLGRIGGPEEVDGKPVKRGVAEINIDFDMAEFLAGAYIMPFHEALLTINTHLHPYSFSIGWKLCFLHNENFGKSTANTTTVKTLLDSAEGIPRYSDLAARGNIYDRLIYPFDRDLAYLIEIGVLSTYWYYDDNGKKIESAQLGGLSYAEFESLHIHYEMNNYPDQTPRLEAKAKRIKATISRNKNAAKKKAEHAGDGAN